MSKLLFIGAHYDDIELSCGGTIVKMLEQGHEVMYVGLSRCNNPLLANECLASLLQLGITERILEDLPYRQFDKERQYILDLLIDFRNQYKPDIVFTHSAMDRHQDHSIVGAESLRVFRNCLLITYTAAWNKTSEAKHDNYFVQLTADQVEKKVYALNKYTSQQKRKYMDCIETTAKFTGNIISVDYAESFHIERWIE